jgi:membrane dipeptidase
VWCGCSEQWWRPIAALPVDRRQALKPLAALVAAGCGITTSAHRDAARRLAEESVSVDLHSHPGMLRTISTTSLEEHLERMGRSKVRASLFAAVGDGPVIGRRPGGLYAAREPQPGELHRYTYRSLDDVRARVNAGKLTLIQSPADVDRPDARRRPGAFLAVEGGDFLEGRIERVQEAYERGVRSIQLTHYRINELGDIQTDPARHGGLTAFGKDVIREMRSVSAEHARLVAGTGGVIGVFPVNSGGYHGLAGYVEHIVRMIKTVGIDHVGIGTDMDGITPPSFAAFDDYSEWPSITAALLARGYSRDDVAKIVGGNFMRLYREVAAT